MAMQSMLKELRTLKQEEMTLINLASKVSDQLNRLKVEELGLQDLVRIQNEEQERMTRGTDRSFLSSNPRGLLERETDGEADDDGEEVELDLSVGNAGRLRGLGEQEEEEEEEEEMAETPNDIEEFVEQLS